MWYEVFISCFDLKKLFSVIPLVIMHKKQKNRREEHQREDTAAIHCYRHTRRRREWKKRIVFTRLVKTRMQTKKLMWAANDCLAREMIAPRWNHGGERQVVTIQDTDINHSVHIFSMQSNFATKQSSEAVVNVPNQSTSWNCFSPNQRNESKARMRKSTPRHEIEKQIAASPTGDNVQGNRIHIKRKYGSSASIPALVQSLGLRVASTDALPQPNKKLSGKNARQIKVRTITFLLSKPLQRTIIRNYQLLFVLTNYSIPLPWRKYHHSVTNQSRAEVLYKRSQNFHLN